MTSYKMPIALDTFGEEEKQAVIDVLDSGRYTMGRKVEQFEEKFSNWLGIEHCVMVNSGSSANLLLVYSLLFNSQGKIPLQRGDEVLVPALSWPTTVWPLTQFGLKPVLVDIDPNSLAIDLESARENLSTRTRAMMLIHVLGQACEMGSYSSFCKEHNLILIEDCCEALGAFSRKSTVGSFGIGGSFSHFFSHHLSTIEGGSVVTNDGNLSDDIRSFRAHGWIRDRKDKEDILKKYPEFDSRFLFYLPGFNARPTEIQAAIGIVQLDNLDRNLENRCNFVIKVAQMSKKIPWLRLIGREYLHGSVDRRSERTHSWMYIPFVIAPKSPAELEEVKNIFEHHLIETRPIISGNLSKHPAFQFIDAVLSKNLSNSDYVHNNGFMIGCHYDYNFEVMEGLEEAFDSLARM